MQRSAVTLAVIVALVGAAIIAGRATDSPCVPVTCSPAGTSAEPPQTPLLVEGLSEPEIQIGLAQLASSERPMEKIADASAVDGWCLTVPEGPEHKQLNPADKIVKGVKVPNGVARFEFRIETPGEYVLWAHKWWCCSCGKSFRYSFDGGPWHDFITDSNYRVWEWAAPRNARIRLESGRHALTIANRQDGFRVDRFLLTTGAQTPAPLERNP